LLPRDASQQAKIGKAIQLEEDFSNLQPGDLLFFGRKEHGQNKITHVAIHINNGQIIHATGEVKIESLNPNDADYNKYRHQSLLAARRVLSYYPQNLLSIYQ
jgi:cell wall-associated NlpC family hydrolase